MRRLALIAAVAVPLHAQCVMCYRTAHAQNAERSRVMNLGILILGAPPFVIIGGFIMLLRKRDKEQGTTP